MLTWIGRGLGLLGLGFLIADVSGTAPRLDYDGTLTSLGSWWFWLDKDSLQVLQPAVERHLSPALWDPGIQTLLEWPAALEFLVLGGLFIGLGRLFRRG